MDQWNEEYKRRQDEKKKNERLNRIRSAYRSIYQGIDPAKLDAAVSLAGEGTPVSMDDLQEKPDYPKIFTEMGHPDLAEAAKNGMSPMQLYPIAMKREEDKLAQVQKQNLWNEVGNIMTDAGYDAGKLQMSALLKEMGAPVETINRELYPSTTDTDKRARLRMAAIRNEDGSFKSWEQLTEPDKEAYLSAGGSLSELKAVTGAPEEETPDNNLFASAMKTWYMLKFIDIMSDKTLSSEQKTQAIQKAIKESEAIMSKETLPDEVQGLINDIRSERGGLSTVNWQKSQKELRVWLNSPEVVMKYHLNPDMIELILRKVQ